MDLSILSIGFVLILSSILIIKWMDKLWFRITLGVLFLAAIIAIAYYGGSTNS